MAKRNYWQTVSRQRVSRRRLIAAGGAGAAGLAIAAACGGGGGGGPAATPGGATPAAGEPVYGGRFQAARNAVFDTLDPYNSVASLNVFPRIYNVLMKVSALKPDEPIYDLAESFEQPTETEYIFSIRPGVRVPPNDYGVPERDMDAEDVVVAHERIMTLPEATACTFICNWIDSHEATDPMTYVLRTPRPYAYFLIQIGGTNFFQTIPPRELNMSPDLFREGGVGGGPFFIPRGQFSESEFVTMEKNTLYYGRDAARNNNQLPYIDGIDTRVVPDPAAVRVAFESKQSYTYAARNSGEADELLGRYDIYEGDRSPQFNYNSLTVNVEREPWDDPRIRKAALYAINRQEYIDIIYQGDAQANGILAWPLGVYVLPEDELAQLQPYNPELSKQLIQEAGYTLPLNIDLIFPTGDFIQMDQHLAIWLQQMEDAGFQVTQHPMDLGTWIGQFTEKNYDASLHPNLEYETPEFPLDFQTSLGPAGSGIFSNGMQDPEVDAAVAATKQITDQDELVAAIHEVQRLIYDRGPTTIPIVSAFTRTLIWNFVKNFPTGGGTADLIKIDFWLDGAPS
jgi:peptide/nickel transport system substrate-binding protein